MPPQTEEKLTPLMSQYRSLKAEHTGEILFFRLGDFYEMFDEDALEVSRLLNLTLTKRVGSPMCGIPFHAAKVYISRLLRAGKKIALCDQVGIPTGKGITERAVTEVITAGTAVDEAYLEQGAANFLAALWVSPGGTAAFACLDGSTAAFFATSWAGADMREAFAREMGRSHPRELLLCESLRSTGDLPEAVQSVLRGEPDISVSYHPEWLFSLEKGYKKLCETFGTVNLKAFSLTPSSAEVGPAGFLVDYLEKNISASLPHLKRIRVFRDEDYLILDDASRRNLEIDRNLQDGGLSNTLFTAVNHTKTAMGMRLLQQWLSFPLRDPEAIRERLRSVRSLSGENRRRNEVRSILSGIADVERLAGRIALDRINPKQTAALKKSLEAYVKVRSILDPGDFSGIDPKPAAALIELVERALLDDPALLPGEGGIIREGWSAELDRLRAVKQDTAAILEEYVTMEKQRTGISSLRLRDNHLIGYYLEVPKTKHALVPQDFQLRRTLVNADCYTTEALSRIASEVSGAEERIFEEEKRLFQEVCAHLRERVEFLQEAAAEIAFIDVTASFAHLAVTRQYVCPTVDSSGVFQVTAGRHPVVETFLPAGEFVPNDGTLGNGVTFSLITGPNMAGKSTYLRQNALILLLAQVGSFVPAQQARLGVADRIFCRVGAQDNLAKGESTFLVEMNETAHILHNATEKSLVIMDEVGRGTSTEDGLSIAWAVSEYLLETVKCKTFFATHYHELTRLVHSALQLLCLDVLEQDGNVVFLKRIREGASANSYGIHVAKLAGIPDEVIIRARSLLSGFQGSRTEQSVLPFPPPPPASSPEVPLLFSEEELVLNDLLSMNPDNLTPLEALEKLHRWHRQLAPAKNPGK